MATAVDVMPDAGGIVTSIVTLAESPGASVPSEQVVGAMPAQLPGIPASRRSTCRRSCPDAASHPTPGAARYW